jgi:cytoskeletal protein RodZ
MKNEQDIDKLFRRGLTDPVNETGFREDDWDNLEQLLDGNKKRRGIVYWLPVISSVAAMLLLVLGWWLFKPQQIENGQKPKQIAVVKLKQAEKPETNSNVTDNNNTVPATNNTSATSTVTNGTGIANTAAIAATKTNNNKLAAANKPESYARNLAGKKHPVRTVYSEGYIIEPKAPAVTPAISNSSTEGLVAYQTTAIIPNAANGITAAKPVSHEIDNSAYAKLLAVQRNKEIVTKSSLKHPVFALSIMGAPEINGVNSFESGKTGINGSFLISVNMNKITISTGAGYAKKPYNTSFENYHSSGYTFKTYPINVVADCRAIDIPLNIDYQVFSKHQNKISIGTGVSSYLMMHENYSYQYADPTARGPRSYTIASPGRYLFGVLNLQATYQRQINSKVGVSVQPYLKLPLTNIGASQVKLQSAGVALGLSWNINSLTKP